ncbi:MAG: glycosyltransferase involved in cell wall biosynthesis, partial [Oceanospirillaceae bacterium]
NPAAGYLQREMKSAPFFSIVTPTYNREQFLLEMIQSVQAQSFLNYEHIIVDDGSIDGSEILVSRLAEQDDRIIYLKQENQGRCVARNVGIEKSRGEYICFLDSDDFWKSAHLASIKKAIADNPKPGLFVTGLTWLFEDEDRSEEVNYRPRELYGSDVEFVIDNEFAPDAVCVNRNILKTFKFNPELFINEDLELWARIAVENTVCLVNKNTAILRVHQGNTSQEVNDYLAPQKAVFELQLQNPQVRSKLTDKFIAYRLRGFDELKIRHFKQVGKQFSVFISTIRFLLKHPSDPYNKTRLVGLIYMVPGSRFLKKLVHSRR